jgi:hypothetical protein
MIGILEQVQESEFRVIAARWQHKRDQGNWEPACNRTEVPFTSRSGLRLLYCYQATTGKHAYLNCDTDIILTDDEATALKCYAV